MRILLADDHDLLRDTLTLLFDKEPDIEAVFTRDLDSALVQMAEAGPFDVVLLDYNMPGMKGLEGLQRALDAGTAANVALISGIAQRTVAERAIAMGARGFVPKTLPAKSLINAIRFMAAGEQFAPLGFLMQKDEPLDGNAPEHDLLPREIEVLRGLCEGKTNKEIARDMNLREPTVKLYVKTMLRKIGAKNRTQAALYGRSKGFM